MFPAPQSRHESASDSSAREADKLLHSVHLKKRNQKKEWQQTPCLPSYRACSRRQEYCGSCGQAAAQLEPCMGMYDSRPSCATDYNLKGKCQIKMQASHMPKKDSHLSSVSQGWEMVLVERFPFHSAVHSFQSLIYHSGA